MKKIAVITAGFAPVPAVDGGAVEVLTTCLINENEKNQEFEIDLYSIADNRLENFRFINTRIIQIYVCKQKKVIEKFINRLARRIGYNKNVSFYYRGLCKELGNHRDEYDIVIFENVMEIFQEVNKLLKCRQYILHLHNDLNPVSKSVTMAKNLKKAGVTLVAVSEFIKNQVISQVESDFGNNFVLYNCIDYEMRQQYEGLSKEDERNNLGFAESDYVLLYVGRLNAEKGILELASAFADIKCKNIKLVVCGGTWGTEFKENKFTKQIYETLGERIRDVLFTGYVSPEKLIRYYKASDAVVIPSICQEAFGMVMLEAALYGKPIVATRSGGMPEILSDDCALYIDLDKNLCNELKNKILWCYSHMDEAEKIGCAASKSILGNEKFKQEKYYENFKKILESSFLK